MKTSLQFTRKINAAKCSYVKIDLIMILMCRLNYIIIVNLSSIRDAINLFNRNDNIYETLVSRLTVSQLTCNDQ